MKRRGVIVCLAFAVFVLLTLPSISAVESNTVLNLKKSFSYKTTELIKEQINNKLFLKLNNSILLSILYIILSILLDGIALRLIKHDNTKSALLILLIHLFIITPIYVIFYIILSVTK